MVALDQGVEDQACHFHTGYPNRRTQHPPYFSELTSTHAIHLSVGKEAWIQTLTQVWISAKDHYLLLRSQQISLHPDQSNHQTQTSSACSRTIWHTRPGD